MNTCHRILAAAIVLAAVPVLAQPAIGYADPDDLDALLAYRLPDWGWNEWNGVLRFRGAGQSGGETTANSNSLNLATDATWVREGERLAWEVTGSSAIDLQANHSGDADREQDSDSFISVNDARGEVRRYLGDSPAYLVGEAGLGWRYREFTYDRSDWIAEERRFERSLDLDAAAGVGIGRVRNVTPMILARRLGERLVALGRPPLTTAQLQAVAEALVRRPGYEANYERSERHFWDAVLKPVLDPARPLAPYEILYLLDLDREGTYSRFEGLRGQVQATWSEQRTNNDRGSGDMFDSSDLRPHRWGAETAVQWSHNLSLVTQVAVRASAQYAWVDGPQDDRDEAIGELEVFWLRDIADRHRLAVAVTADGRYTEIDGGDLRRELQTSVRVTDRIWVEDSFSINPYAEVRHATASASDGAAGSPQTTWSYGINARYYFDSALF
ncbi:MAG: hypothetical protein R3D98_10385 [Candidatus Krumholzibacteriia bacterium]